jgi:mannose-6-phosphate isomerase-like protein (cupin superfamily)
MAKKSNVHKLSVTLKDAYSHIEVARINDHAGYVMYFKGGFPMHSHVWDEFYMVLEGKVTITFKKGGTEVLRKGECLTVPAYVTHNTESKEGATVFMVKPKDMFYTAQDIG